MSNGLPRRPEVPAEELAAVTAIAQALLTATVAETVTERTPSWRFSGRWFGARHQYALRDPRG